MDNPKVQTNALRRWIDENGLRHQYVAMQLGITKAYLSRLVSAKPPYPSREMAAQISALTSGKVSANDFVFMPPRVRKARGNAA